jgi:mitochondrial import receptor subunit TOM40
MSSTANNPFFPPGVPAPPGTGPEQVGPGAPSPFLRESKGAYPITAKDSHATSFLGFLDPVLRPVGQFMESVSEKRKALGLPFPGTAEHLQREVKSGYLREWEIDEL